MLVDNLMFDSGTDAYYDDAFRHVLEDHLTYLREHTSTQSISLDPGMVYKFESDFFGLLMQLRVPVYLHWLTMRMNKEIDPMRLGLDTQVLLIPNSQTVDYIRQSHMSTRRVT